MREGEAIIQAVRDALIEGEQSGEPRLVDFDALKDRMRERRRRASAPAPPTAKGRKWWSAPHWCWSPSPTMPES